MLKYHCCKERRVSTLTSSQGRTQVNISKMCYLILDFVDSSFSCLSFLGDSITGRDAEPGGEKVSTI